MAAMQAAVLRHPGPDLRSAMGAAEVSRPEPARGELLIDVEACGVCRTDLQLCSGDLGAHALPVVPGHQIVGRVAAQGEPAGDEPMAPVGTRVGVTWLAGACGDCRFCMTGRENLCLSATFTGWDRDGGYAEYVCADAAFVHPLPERAGATAIAPLLCAGVIGYRSLRVAGLGPGSAPGRLGLFGFGASASIVIQVAKHWGLEVYVCTRSPAEQSVAMELGAVWAGGFDETPPVALDAAITTAPVGRSISNAVRALDRGGIVAVNAIHLDEVPRMDYDDLWWERQIRSVANVTRRDSREFLELATSIPVTTIRVERPLAEAVDALEDLAAGKVDGSVVLTP